MYYSRDLSQPYPQPNGMHVWLNDPHKQNTKEHRIIKEIGVIFSLFSSSSFSFNQKQFRKLFKAKGQKVNSKTVGDKFIFVQRSNESERISPQIRRGEALSGFKKRPVNSGSGSVAGGTVG